MNEQVVTIEKYFAIWLLKGLGALENIFTPSVHYLWTLWCRVHWSCQNTAMEYFFTCINHGKEYNFDVFTSSVGKFIFV